MVTAGRDTTRRALMRCRIIACGVKDASRCSIAVRLGSIDGRAALRIRPTSAPTADVVSALLYGSRLTMTLATAGLAPGVGSVSDTMARFDNSLGTPAPAAAGDVDWRAAR